MYGHYASQVRQTNQPVFIFLEQDSQPFTQMLEIVSKEILGISIQEIKTLEQLNALST
jgi:uncharacterized protein YegL